MSFGTILGPRLGIVVCIFFFLVIIIFWDAPHSVIHPPTKLSLVINLKKAHHSRMRQSRQTDYEPEGEWMSFQFGNQQRVAWWLLQRAFHECSNQLIWIVSDPGIVISGGFLHSVVLHPGIAVFTHFPRTHNSQKRKKCSGKTKELFLPSFSLCPSLAYQFNRAHRTTTTQPARPHIPYEGSSDSGYN